MNKVSINSRKIYPSESMPAEIIDFELTFFSKSGVACADAKPGDSFHGVVHKCTQEEMKILDGIEKSYDRIPSKAKLYDGKIIDCTVYSDPKGEIDHSNDMPPTERYLQIMTEGAEHYGVN